MWQYENDHQSQYFHDKPYENLHLDLDINDNYPESIHLH